MSNQQITLVAVPIHILYFERDGSTGGEGLQTRYEYLPLIDVPRYIRDGAELKEFERQTCNYIGRFVHRCYGARDAAAIGQTHVLLTPVDGGRRRTYFANLREFRCTFMP